MTILFSEAGALRKETSNVATPNVLKCTKLTLSWALMLRSQDHGLAVHDVVTVSENYFEAIVRRPAAEEGKGLSR
jgi:hypothetical protein